jgi:hypothetical protein
LVEFYQKKNGDCHKNNYCPGIIDKIGDWIIRSFVHNICFIKLFSFLREYEDHQADGEQERQDNSQIVVC